MIDTGKVKLICFGCLLETPIESGVAGSVYNRQCARCGAVKKHVIRAANHKTEGFATTPGRAAADATFRHAGRSNWLEPHLIPDRFPHRD